MKVRINPDKGTMKIRFTLGDAVNVGLALATVRIVYDFTQSFYKVSVRRLAPKVSAAVEKLEEMKEQS